MRNRDTATARRRAGVLLVLALSFLLTVSLLSVGLPARILSYPGDPVLLPHQGPLGWARELAVLDGGAGSTPATGELIAPSRPGPHTYTLRLFGWLPAGRVTVQVVPRVRVVPGGQSIGILLAERGLLVSDRRPLTGPDGRRVDPAARAGIQAGDLLLAVDGEPATSVAQVRALVQQAGREGRPLRLLLRRGGRERQVALTPVQVGREYLLGLYLRDPAAGVGTLTFYDPVTRRFGALGHPVVGRGQRPEPMAEGRIIAAYISHIEQAFVGFPGEKVGIFRDRTSPLGRVDTNSSVGIFGRLERLPIRGPVERPVPVALASQVHPGPAEMLTVVEGERVERFAVEILAVDLGGRKTGRGLTLRVTDPALLARTRGIVQGMSGSPLLQGGRLIGAVTHVFLNDPAKGYGTLAEWMLQEAGLLYKEAAGL